MQLMAGVKCCTNRRLTNHPHFEDKQLRDVTKGVIIISKNFNSLTSFNLTK